MTGLVLALAGVLFILIVSELLCRTKVIGDETARKVVHISVGSFVAFWPYFMTWHEIQLMSLAFFVVVLVSLKVNFFHSIHNVKRKTWGELCFPVGIGLSALIAPPSLIFTAAILHLSLADGFAAIIGLRYGMLHKYTIRNYTKTVAGTISFFVISTVIVLGTVVASQNGLSWPLLPLLVWLPLAATLVENLAVAGTDNVFVPLLVIAVLQLAGIS